MPPLIVSGDSFKLEVWGVEGDLVFKLGRLLVFEPRLTPGLAFEPASKPEVIPD